MMSKTVCGSIGRLFAFCLCISLLIVFGSGIATIASFDRFCNPLARIRDVVQPSFRREASRISDRNFAISTWTPLAPWLWTVLFLAFPLGSSVVTAPLHPLLAFEQDQRILTPGVFFFAVYVSPSSTSLSPPLHVLIISIVIACDDT